MRRWQIGAKQRLAFDPPDQHRRERRSDVVGMGPQHIKDGRIGVQT